MATKEVFKLTPMNIVQTYWPGQKDFAGIVANKAGWLSPMFHYMSWALSCNLLLKYFPSVKLYTTNDGIRFFKDILRLPYEYEEVDFFETIKFPKELWALSKIDVYRRQTEPFFHMDGDVFIRKPINSFLGSPLVVQNLEDHFAYNSISIAKAREYKLLLPEFIARNIESNGTINSVNAGTIGGADIPFFQEYANSAIHFYEMNKDTLLNNKITNHFNCLIEQIFFYNLALSKGKEVECILPNRITDDYKIISSFEGTEGLGYVHPVGTYKRNRSVCQQMAGILEKEFPETFEQIASYYKKEYSYWFELTRIYEPPTEGWMNCKI